MKVVRELPTNSAASRLRNIETMCVEHTLLICAKNEQINVRCSVPFVDFFLSTFVRSRIPNSPAQNDAENFATHSFTISHIRIFSQCSNVSNSMAG